MAILENLPLDCQLSILNYLDINSLLKLRLLNKNFYQIVQNVRIYSLSIMNSEFIFQKYNCELGLELDLEGVERFFYTNELIKQSTNLLLSNGIRLFKSNFVRIILSRIKKLYIKEAPVNSNQQFNLELLNQFNSLEQIQISKLRLGKKSLIINLKNLKILYIHKIITNYRLILRTPQLFALKCESLEFYSFNYPEKIKYLFLIEIPNPNDRQFNKLKNLKSIFFDNNQFYNYIYPDFSSLNELEEVHLNSLLEKSIRTLFENKLDKNAKFKIYLNGINLNGIEDINQFYDELGRLKNFQINKFIELNYSKTYHFIPNVFELNYNYLITLNVISDNFNRKFPNLYKIIVDKNDKIDQLIFINFILTIKDTLRILDINAIFDQNFYDNLDKYCPYLASIHINADNHIDLDFLSKNKNIQIFIINQTIELKLLEKFFNCLKQLDKLTFFSIKLKNIIIYVKIKVRNCSPNHTIEITFNSPYSNRSYFKNLNSMIDFINNLIKS